MTERTIPTLTLPATQRSALASPGPFSVFLPGDQMRPFRVGDEVSFKLQDAEVTAPLTQRAQGNLVQLMSSHGAAYLPMRAKPMDTVSFADALEANLPDAPTPCDMREFYTVLIFDAGGVKDKEPPAPTGAATGQNAKTA